MSDLISREALIEKLEEYIEYDTFDLYKEEPLISLGFEQLEDIICSQPTVEVKEVVNAKWIDGCCSNCGAYIPTDSLWDYISEKECNFCYECGADMRGEKHE